jgi:hypothetical protein
VSYDARRLFKVQEKSRCMYELGGRKSRQERKVLQLCRSRVQASLMIGEGSNRGTWYGSERKVLIVEDRSCV